MTISSEKYVGIDVSKQKLDVAVWDEKGCPEFSNSKKGLQSWGSRCWHWDPNSLS